MSDNASSYDRSRTVLLTILLAALVIRVAYLIIYSNLPAWDQLTVDNYYHHNWALSIADGNVLGDTTYFRAPFYVYCLAALYAVLGSSLWVGRIFGLLVGLASVFMTYRIGTRAFSYRVGLVAAAIQAMFPINIYFESELLLDPLFTLILQIAVYYVLVWWESQTVRDIFIAGLMFGLAAITRPTALVLLPVVVLLMTAIQINRRRLVRQMAAFVIGVVLVILPITLRNLIVEGDPVLISSQGGINLYIGNNESADGISATMPEPLGFNWRIRQITHIAETDQGKKLDPGEVSSYWLKQSTGWILRNSDDFLRLYGQKLYHNISNREISNNRSLVLFFDRIPILKYNPLSFGILFALTVLGTWLCLGNNRKGVFLFALIATYVIVSSLFFFSSRFRLPLLPYYTVLAGAALYWITNGLMRKLRHVMWSLLAVIALGIFSFYPVVALPPGNPSQPLLSEGLYFLAIDDYRAALNSFTQARQIDPAFPETNLNIAAAYMRLGQMDSAMYFLGEEQRLNPGRAKANINKASIHLVNHEYQDAVREARAALETRPYDVMANKALLRALAADSQRTTAELRDSSNQAADRTGDDIFLLNDAASLLAARGDLQSAEAFLIRAALSEPPPIETDDYAFERQHRNSAENWSREMSNTYYQRGYIYGLKGEFEQSIEFTRHSIELDSSRAEAYVNLISGCLSSHRVAEAHEVLSVALSKFPDNPYLKQIELNLRK